MLELSMDYYFGSIICFFMKDVYLCTFLFDITPYDLSFGINFFIIYEAALQFHYQGCDRATEAG